MKLGVVMDPIQTINPGHDSTLAMLEEAAARGWPIFYFEPKDLFVREAKAYGDARLLKVFRDPQRWFAFEGSQRLALSDLDLILVRKDPPFDQEYLYLTQLLELAEQEGVSIVNKPQALRDLNEKLAINFFPDCCVPTLVARKIALLKAFWKEEEDLVCKPLHVMGGQSVFRIKPKDPNASVIFEMLTAQESRFIMAQRYIPEIEKGDKRILLIKGEPIPFALARIPQGEDWRGNMATGAKALAQPLTKRDKWICQQLAPFLCAKGIHFAGIDIIGDYLTEINVTSPTGIRELDEQTHLNISAQLLDYLETLRG